VWAIALLPNVGLCFSRGDSHRHACCYLGCPVKEIFSILGGIWLIGIVLMSIELCRGYAAHRRNGTTLAARQVRGRKHKVIGNERRLLETGLTSTSPGALT
jgi:hypothetical protein